MAASAYLVELDERRRQTLAEVIDHLGIASGTAEHEVALSFGLHSLSNNGKNHMDSEKNKVRGVLSNVHTQDTTLPVCFCWLCRLNQLLNVLACIVCLHMLGYLQCTALPSASAVCRLHQLLMFACNLAWPYVQLMPPRIPR